VGVGGKPELSDTQHNRKAKERARQRRQRHLQSDRLGSMAGSQATTGLRGGAVRDSGQQTNSELTWLGPASARRPGPQQGRASVLTSRSGRDDEVVERAAWNGLEQRKQSGAVHGLHSDIFLVQKPRSLAFRRGSEQHGEEEAGGPAR
jgi:hypothetical protein